ncbi:MAG: YjgP/YjgQ family permease [Balneolaceae bacterium]|nr:YjgP/YjgQ family permease [Balneolaceae bacterium]
MFLLLMQFLILHIDKLIGKDIPFIVIVDLIITNLSYMVVLAAPMAVMVGTLMAFGRFSELNELTALRASGINPLKVIVPVLFASVILCVVLAWFSNSVLPEANQKARSLFIDIRLKKPGFDLNPNVFYDGIEGYTFLVDHINKETDSLYNVTVFQEPTQQRNRAYIKAEKGFLESNGSQALTLHLFQGSILEHQGNRRGVSNIVQRMNFQKYTMTMDLSDMSFFRSDPSERNRSERTMSAQAMLVVVDSLRKEISKLKNKLAVTERLLPAEEYPSDIPLFRERIAREEERAGGETTVKKQAIESQYMLPNSFDDPELQHSFIDESVRKLKTYKSSLENTISNIEWRKKRISRFLVEVHKKLSIPFACIAFILFGAPVGIMVKSGNFGVAALVSAVVLTFYWVALIQGEKLADRLYISPFSAMWTFNILLSTIGIYLIIHITTDYKITKLFTKRA